MSEPERYLLDTSAVIDLPSPAQITPDAEYLISSITLAELNAGIHAAQGRNHRPRRMDLLIASVAAHHRLPLLTHNPADFTYLSPLLIMIGLDDK